MRLCVNESVKKRKATARIKTADVDAYCPRDQKKKTRATPEGRQGVITRSR